MSDPFFRDYQIHSSPIEMAFFQHYAVAFEDQSYSLVIILKREIIDKDKNKDYH